MRAPLMYLCSTPVAFCQVPSDWLAALPGISLGATVEIPYANAQGVEVNADTARSFGRDLAKAIREHLAEGSG